MLGISDVCASAFGKSRLESMIDDEGARAIDTCGKDARDVFLKMRQLNEQEFSLL